MKLFVFINIIICLSVVVTAEYGNASVCAKCLSDTEKLADEIKKATVDIAPLTTCAAIGDAVSKATNNSIAGVVVGVICGFVGFETFKKEFNKTVLNYGWYCEHRNKCEDKTGAGSVDSVGVNSPLKLGDDIKLKIIFSVSKEAGVLEFLFACVNKTDTKYTKISKQFDFPANVGQWEADWEIATDKSWAIGSYTCTIKLCNTVCDSFPKVPKKSTFGMEKEVKFVIDKK